MYGDVVVERMDVERDLWKIAWLTESAFPWFTRVTGLPLITNFIQSLMESLQFAWQNGGIAVKCIQLCRKAVSENAAVRPIVTSLKMVVVSTADQVSYLSSSSMSVRKRGLWRQALNILSKLFFSNFFAIKAVSYKNRSTSKKMYSILNNAKQTVGTKRFDVGVPRRVVKSPCAKGSISNLWQTFGLAGRQFDHSPLSNTDTKYKKRFLDHTQRRTTIGRTPLDEWSALRRDLYLTTHNTHNRQTDMPSAGFEPTISAGESRTPTP